MERCTMMRLRRDSEQTPHHPNISPHISHATRAEKRAAAPYTTSLSFVKLFSPGSPLGYGALFTHSCWEKTVACFINNSQSQSLQ